MGASLGSGERTQNQNANFNQGVQMTAVGPPQLPPLVAGEQVRNGPFLTIVTESMVIRRERENQEIKRQWEAAERRRQRRLEMQLSGEDYFDDFKDFNIRRRFIRRVFLILSIQLMFTSLVVAAMQYEKVAIIEFFKQRMEIVLMIIISELILLLYFFCSNTPRGTTPCAWICLCLLTVSLSFTTGFTALFFKNEIVLMAASTTAVVTLVIFFVAACTKFDLTKHTGIFMVFSIVIAISLVVCGIVMIFQKDRILDAAFGTLGCLFFSLWLFWDIQAIMGGRRVEISPDEVVYATFLLYFDIIMMFRYILYILRATVE